MDEVVTLTVRLPRPLWIRLRRLQEQRKIKSIQQAVVDALERVWKDEGKE